MFEYLLQKLQLTLLAAFFAISWEEKSSKANLEASQARKNIN